MYIYIYIYIYSAETDAEGPIEPLASARARILSKVVRSGGDKGGKANFGTVRATVRQ